MLGYELDGQPTVILRGSAMKKYAWIYVHAHYDLVSVIPDEKREKQKE